jgi:hypothetical protein
MLLIALLPIILGIAVALAGPYILSWLETDRCLDSGGKIDQENKKCVREKNNEYP